MYWLEVSVVTDGEAAEAVAEALRPFPAGQSVVLEQAGDPHNLDPYALEPEVTVKIFLSADEDTPAVRRRIAEVLYHLGRLYPIPEPTFRKLEDKDWAHAWKEHYQPFRVGRRIWIQPSWIAGEAPESEDIMLVLDPGMAFGTGLHPTTQMCLQAVERLARPGLRVLDVGTGSGILAIAAAKLGVGPVLGIDNDAQAVSAASANVRQNGVAEQVTISAGTLATIRPAAWDLVLVNILAPVIITLLSEHQLLKYVDPAGKLVLSGIIDQQLDDVTQALHAAGGEVVETLTIRDWVTLIAQRA
jgi:ribosomal protein L11 methyltransferase